MAFLIPDNLKSRRDVSSAVQKVASAFQAALDEDVTVWFEPLFRPRASHFTLVDPRLGVLVLQLASIEQNVKVLGVLRGAVRIEADGREGDAPNPLDAAEEHAARVRAALLTNPAIAHVPVGALALLPSERRAEAAVKRLDTVLDLRRVVFRDEIDAAVRDDDATGLLRCFNVSLSAELDEPLSSAEVDAVRAAIHPDVVVRGHGVQPSLFGVDEEKDVVRVMDRKQEAMAKSLGTGHRVLRGVAGSGKTLVLVHRARLLARLLPSKRILVTCFNRSLASQLRAQLDEHDNVEVVHLDRLMGWVIGKAGLEHPGHGQGGEVVAAVALEGIRKLEAPRYRAVLVDEAQDFDTSALQFCVELLEAGDPKAQDLVIVADSAQNVYRKSFRWKDAGIEAQGRTRILRTNYRNTREILEFAHRFLTADPTINVDASPDAVDSVTIIPPESALRTGPEPDVALVPDPMAEAAKVVELVKAAYAPGMRPRSIAVLHGDGVPNLGRSVMELLGASGVPAYWVTDPNEKENKDHAGDTSEPVVVSTIYSAKGLEYPHVVVGGIAPGRSADELAARKLAYVGFTRAINRLAVVAVAGSRFATDLEPE